VAEFVSSKRQLRAKKAAEQAEARRERFIYDDPAVADMFARTLAAVPELAECRGDPQQTADLMRLAVSRGAIVNEDLEVWVERVKQSHMKYPDPGDTLGVISAMAMLMRRRLGLGPGAPVPREDQPRELGPVLVP
jgi:hypothetical protein